MKQKVFACITRLRAGQRQVLVFTHRDYPEAGVQVPGGTVSVGEALEVAVWRELQEESGLSAVHVQLVGLVSANPHPDWGTLEHIYHFTAADSVPDAWTHTVYGTGDDVGLVFEYRWLDLEIDLTRWTSRVPPWL